MFAIYDALSFLTIWLILVPWHLALIATRKFAPQGLLQRLGGGKLPPREKAYRVLIHAVSVGEVTAAEPLVRELLRMTSEVELVVTTGNNNGMRAARQLQSRYHAITHVQFLPWDWRRTLSTWIHRLDPDLVAIIETELWPNLIRECQRRNTPLCIINGRVYPSDIWRYRLANQFFRRVLSHVDWIGVQSEMERNRFLAIGAASQGVEVIGNIKFDVSLPPSSASE